MYTSRTATTCPKTTGPAPPAPMNSATLPRSNAATCTASSSTPRNPARWGSKSRGTSWSSHDGKSVPVWFRLGRVRERFMLAKRIIPCLDVTGGRVVKGVNFVNLRDAGDPVELAERYNGDGADELDEVDITASSDAREIMEDQFVCA